MRYRTATILPVEDHTADTTKVIDINVVDPISQIVVMYEPHNAASGAPTGHPVRGISKIELVDGSDVLYSLSGAEAQAVDFYHNKREPANILMYLNGNYSQAVIPMNFGRYLWDPLLALDPTKFKNPQLKISIDISEGGMSVDTARLTVMAFLFDEKVITPTGFLMHKEIKDYAMGAGTHEYTDLPVDYPYRKLFVRAQVYGTGLDWTLGNIKLSEDQDKKIPLDATIAQVLMALISGTRPYREWIIGNPNTSPTNFYCTPTYWPAFAFSQWVAEAASVYSSVYGGDGGRFTQMYTGTGYNWQVHCEGWGPHGVIEIPFGLQDDPADWYDVTKIKSLKADIVSGGGMSESETCQILLQQLRSY